MREKFISFDVDYDTNSVCFIWEKYKNGEITDDDVISAGRALQLVIRQTYDVLVDIVFQYNRLVNCQISKKEVADGCLISIIEDIQKQLSNIDSGRTVHEQLKIILDEVNNRRK